MPSAPPEAVSVALFGVSEASQGLGFCSLLTKVECSPCSPVNFCSGVCCLEIELHVVGSHVESTAMVVALQVVTMCLIRAWVLRPET